MPIPSAEKQRAYRERQAAKVSPAKTASKRLTRLLLDHPKKLAKFDAFMWSMNREIADEARKVKEWQEGRKVSMDYNEDSDPNS